MNRKTILLGAIVAASLSATPAMATWNWPKPKPPSSSTSGGTTTSTGGTTTSSSTGGTKVPEPGMLGLMGLGLLGLGLARRRRKAA